MFATACGLFAPLVGDHENGWKQYVQSVTMRSVVPKAAVEVEPISPFDVYDGDRSYHWPDLYTEADEMLEICVLLYPLVEIRRIARSGEFDALTAAKALRLPLTHTQLMEVVSANKEKISDTSLKKEFYMKALEEADKRCRSHLSRTTILAVNDEFEQEELVYSVQVNHQRKRITVCFRGSVTKMDWATDYQIYMKEVPNPMRAHASQEETIRVHHGFHDYLLLPNSRGVKGPNGEELSEYREIMYAVIPVLQAHPEYKLYVTGNSMGAALATLFAFGAAAEADNLIPKPVSLFSFAGPYVGDYSFRSAHQLLESLGKLRHLRVSNHKDFVTIIPNVSFQFPFRPESHVGSLFKHVGMNVRLYAGSTPMEISYPRVRSGYFSSALDEFVRGWEQSLFSNFVWNPNDYWTWPVHHLQEYTDRVDANKPILQSIHLNNLYSRKDIVGNLLADF